MKSLGSLANKKSPNVDYVSRVTVLKARGLCFEVCDITLKSRNLEKQQLGLEADFIPSGAARVV